MRTLSPHDILQIWDFGQGQTNVERALTLLAFAFPDHTKEQLAELTIGQRDYYLLQLRELTLGAQLNGFTECPQCGERLEFELNAPDLRVGEPGRVKVSTQGLQVGGFEVQFRLPNSWDLAAIANCQDRVIADGLLLQRCIVQANLNGSAISVQELPLEVITQLTNTMAEADPQAEILLSLNCAACQYEWQSLFDIVSFFWTELNTQGKRLLQEVHILAQYYGWREADILSMSTKRRQLYLEMVTDS
ncbi:MAG: hypothetical protein QNJ33_04535 [Crocosphaera sp.]|nr:hypothetical protein [Crocosphaera sp.]